MIYTLILATLMFVSSAECSPPEIYLSTLKSFTSGVSTVESMPLFTPRQYTDVSEADQLKIQRETESAFFASHRAARAWLVPRPRLTFEVIQRGPERVQRVITGHLPGFSRMVQALQFNANVIMPFIFPGSNRDTMSLAEATLITPGELVLYADDAQIVALGGIEPSVLLDQIKIHRREFGSVEIALSSWLRYRLGRLIRTSITPNTSNFELTFRFIAAGRVSADEIPLFAWTGKEGVEKFRDLFHLRNFRFLRRPYLAERCADVLGVSKLSRTAFR